MSSKIEVSRELADRLTSKASCIRREAMKELRILLAAPVVERQDHVAEVEREFDNDCGHVHLLQDLPDGTKLYAAPPELAELQATIARLKAENERLQATCDGLDSQNDALADEIERLKAEDSEMQAELGRVQCKSNEHFRRAEALADEIERLKAGQRESPFYISAADWNTLVRDDMEIASVRVSRTRRNVFTEQLFTSQPAPVSEEMTRLLTRARIYARGEFRDEIDACLDKVKEMNQ